MNERSTVKIGRKSLMKYCYKNRFQMILLGFFLVLAYGMKIFNIAISHDTEAMISMPDALYGSWLQMGRFGEIFLKKLLGTYNFNAYVAGFMMVVSMFVVAVLWNYVFFCVSEDRNKIILWVFGAVCFASTIMAEHEGFLLQAYEVVFAMGLVALAVLLLLDGGVARKKWRKWIEYVGAMFILMLSFATYQAMVVFYIAVAVMCFLLYYEKNADDTSTKEKWIYILRYIILFVISYVVYAVLNRIILKELGYGTLEYIDGQMAWKTQGIHSCIKNIFEHVVEVFEGGSFFYTKGLGIVVLLMIVKVVWQKKRKDYWLYILATLFLFACPFLMTIVLGSRPSYRTELNIPFVLAFLICMVLDYTKQKRKILFQFGLAVAFIFCMAQSQNVARLYYTEYVQNQEDEMLAVKISDRIDQLDVDTSQVPVAFVGGKHCERNLSCVPEAQLGLTGYSFFEVSYGTMHGTWVMQHYLSTLGINYVLPNEDQVNNADAASQDMPIWPNSESVQYRDGIIIVRLS